MEPLTSAFALSTLVSLIATFKNERRATKQDKFQDFLKWLLENNHKEIKEMLESNKQMSEGVKSLIKQDMQALHRKLENIDEMLAYIVSKIEGFSSLAMAVHPGVVLSDQAIDILRQLEKAEGLGLVVTGLDGAGDEIILHIDGGTGGKISFGEARFVEDDLTTLVKLGLLIEKQGPSNIRKYVITRAVPRLVDMVNM